MSQLELPEELLHRAFSSLSGGERTKLLLALLFLREENFPLIDEPTNHLDLAGRALVGRYLKSKTGFILASHDRALLDGCVDHIVSLDKKGAAVMAGTYTSWERERLRREAFEIKKNEKLKKDILRLDNAAQRTARWSFAVEKTRYKSDNSGVKIDRGYVGHKSAKLMKRAKFAEARKTAAAEEKSKLLRTIEQIDPLRIDSLTHHRKTLVTMENLQVWYGKTPGTPEVSLTVKQGERVALTGKNGSGKTSLLKLVAGEELKHTGLLQTAGGLVVSAVSQETAWLKGDLREFVARFHLDRTQFFTMLRKLGLERAQFEKDVEHFSTGQKKKVLLAKSLCERAHLYLWDEPLNFIDLDSRKQIEDLILYSMPTMLFVEHDAVFLDRVATKQTVLG
jgi:lincosamide and streptogramin A transport system ATP-binding/permease protein